MDVQDECKTCVALMIDLYWVLEDTEKDIAAAGVEKVWIGATWVKAEVICLDNKHHSIPVRDGCDHGFDEFAR